MRYRFAYRPYRRTFPSPLRTAHGAWVEREGAFVRLESESGSVGFGEIAPIAWFGTETLPEALEACAEIGSDPDDVRLDAVPARLGCLRFALASARADVATPLPKADATSGSRDRLPVAALLPAGRAVLEALPRRLEEGFLALKWKVGVGRAEDELSLLDDVLGRLPSYCKLRLDANGAWDRRTAEKWLARCAERPVEFVEQPVAPEHEAVLLGLATDYPVTLALDESVAGLESARAWQGRGWRGVLVMKPALAGPMADLVAWAAQTKPDLVLSSAIETAVGRAAILRVAFAHNLTRRALGFGLGSLFGDRGWDGPAMGPLLDATWADEVKPEELWNAAR
jgi:O-succinylbenzoate synthase